MLPAEQSTLLIPVPAAEPVVGPFRARYDTAARDGIPPHLTVAYPFKPVADLTDTDRRTLRELLAATPSFPLTLPRTGWFGDAVLFLEPADRAPIVELIRRVEAAFPDFPLYGGAFEEPHPHLTIGHDVDPATLRVVEAEVAARLPTEAQAREVQLWSGPDPVARPGPWRCIETFALRRRASAR